MRRFQSAINMNPGIPSFSSFPSRLFPLFTYIFAFSVSRMFHISADDTGSSAIWVAKRVPDDHITVVANQFTIGEIDLADADNYLGTVHPLGTCILFDVLVNTLIH